jgi:hypothetical protein
MHFSPWLLHTLRLSLRRRCHHEARPLLSDPLVLDRHERGLVFVEMNQ